MLLEPRNRSVDSILELVHPEILNRMIGARFGMPPKKKGDSKAKKAKKEKARLAMKEKAVKKMKILKEKAKKAKKVAAVKVKKAKKAAAVKALKAKKTKIKAKKAKAKAVKNKSAKKSPKKSAGKKVATKKSSGAKPWQRPTTMAGLVKAANAAVAGMTRKESAEASRLARDGAVTHKWQYKNDQGRMADYDTAASVEVEKVYATYQVNPYVDVRSVKSGDWHYMLDFNSMTQQNTQHHDHKVRPIQRVAV